MKTTNFFSAIFAIVIMMAMVSCATHKKVVNNVKPIAVKQVMPITEFDGCEVLTDTLFRTITKKSPKKLDSIYWMPSEDIVLWRSYSISNDAVKDGKYITGQNQVDTVIVLKKTPGLYGKTSNGLFYVMFEYDSLKLAFKKADEHNVYSPYILNVMDDKIQYGIHIWNVLQGKKSIILFDKKKPDDNRISRIAKGMKIGKLPVVVESSQSTTEEVKKAPPTQTKPPVRQLPFKRK
ncbi:MAG: hypothetical protein WCG45_01065 [bacterium]